MKYIFCTVLFLTTAFCAAAKPEKHPEPVFFKADNPNIKYIGRIDFSNPELPRFWSPGVYIQAKFEGTSLDIVINDEVLYGNTHNYLEIAIDDNPPFKIQTTGKVNTINVASHLSPGVHTVTVCRDTESGLGYLEFAGLKCEKLLPMKTPKRKMEFIGDSITCGMSSDESEVKCGQGQWYDQHNAYMAYGPITARAVNAQWHVTAVSGIGLIHSCCNLNILIPQVFDKVMLREDSIKWNFNKYIPDVVTICIGQNDGKQDSVAFCSAYVKFIKTIRSHYPNADIVCLSSPMGNAELTAMLKHYITGIEQHMHNAGDKRIYHYFFSRSFNDGCGWHPSMAQHKVIAQELTGYLKGLEKW